MRDYDEQSLLMSMQCSVAPRELRGCAEHRGALRCQSDSATEET